MQSSLTYLHEMFAFKKNQHKGLRLIPLPGVYKRQPFCIKGAGSLEQAEKGEMCSTPDTLCVLKEHKRAGKRVGIFNPQVFASCHNRKTGQKNNKTHTHTQMHTNTHQTERELSRVSEVWSKARQTCRPPELGSDISGSTRWKCHRVVWELLWGVSSGNLALIFKVTPQKTSTWGRGAAHTCFRQSHTQSWHARLWFSLRPTYEVKLWQRGLWDVEIVAGLFSKKRCTVKLYKCQGFVLKEININMTSVGKSIYASWPLSS